jgi:uncharacterized protein YndB with AHSA1/START domain
MDKQPTPRSVELEVEVAGTPEEVWEAIATGPGISAWLHPTEVEERQGGRFRFDMGFGTREGTVTAWEPPHRFAQEVDWQPGGDLPAVRLATEWLVEARGEGTCLVRMVMSGFGTEAGWDEELEGMAAGMRAAVDTLARHRAHFPGQRAAWVQALGTHPGPPPAAWAELAGALGLAGATPGQRVAGGGDPAAPDLAGVVERVGDDAYGRGLLLRADRPGPGLVEVVVLGQGGLLGLNAWWYGEDRAELAARVQPAWAAWMAARFPAPGTPTPGTPASE